MCVGMHFPKDCLAIPHPDCPKEMNKSRSIPSHMPPLVLFPTGKDWEHSYKSTVFPLGSQILRVQGTTDVQG